MRSRALARNALLTLLLGGVTAGVLFLLDAFYGAPSSSPPRDRSSSWAAPPKEDTTRVERLSPGQILGLFQVAPGSMTWKVDVQPRDGDVYAAMVKVEGPATFTEEERARLLSSLSRVAAMQTLPLSHLMRNGDIVGCGVLNRSDRPVTVEIRNRLWELGK